MIGLTDLCAPAEFYLVVSMLALFFITFQNIGNKEIYCLGEYQCMVPSTFGVFVFKIVYIAFWTWLLNILCRGGASWLSWLIALFPIILFFVILSSLFLSNMAIV